jgi:hydroxyethylthiazole kinase-like uncharacterized protein yjeF
MLPILTPEESAALDRASAERGVTVDRLMENAGRAVARAAVTVAGGAYGLRAVALCGKGNNGGDGLVAARHLERSGMGVAVVLLDDPAAYRGAALRNYRRFAADGGRIRGASALSLHRELSRADVVVDAMFGTGFHGAPDGGYAEAMEVANTVPAPVVAVDIPSGVEGETGAVRGVAIHAQVTIALGALKPGVVLYPGAAHAGVVDVADIGVPPDLVGSDLFLFEREDAATLIPARPDETHKRAAGVVLVLAGSRTMTGAAVLAATAAYRTGAGLVTLAVPESVLPAVEGAVAETTFLPLPETERGSASADAWPLLSERLESVDAVAAGPGLTTDPSTVQLVRRLVADSPVPFVLDADGLNAFQGNPQLLADRRSEVVLTPHAGEFGRLRGLSSQEVLEDRVGHARKAAAEFRATMLLKGSRTIVAEPNGRATVNPTGTPALATGGTGDVLTGTVSALLAGGLPPHDAARLGAYVHGVAGQLAGRELGRGTMASDVLRRLPRALARVARAGG